MVQNEFIVSKHLTNNETVLDVWFRSEEDNEALLKEVFLLLPDVSKINVYFSEVMDAYHIEVFQELFKHFNRYVTVKLVFSSLRVSFEKIDKVLSKMIREYTINIYYFSKGALIVEFFGNDIVPFDKHHNLYLYEQLKEEFNQERERPIVNDMRLKQELLTIKNDYDALYDTYLQTHKRMQYAFRELHKFKRSAWKYKKIYLDNEVLLNNLNRIVYYKKKMNKKNLKKALDLIQKKVKSR
ncbi:hypothetical protein GJU84_08295 [Staphylococcus chromogenes]|uniref:hypothetical protein n=2 Tax=Staphylococcus chromogenes TaxID=46126 RepID=UPI0014051B7C|nr:hypothetical protein [Staphylococcus chromogenes]QIN27046.1 hypothetical protein GJU84_08295 [Staphylococcus chromogenes]